jgi:hypothetical protein
MKDSIVWERSNAHYDLSDIEEIILKYILIDQKLDRYVIGTTTPTTNSG